MPLEVVGIDQLLGERQRLAGLMKKRLLEDATLGFEGRAHAQVELLVDGEQTTVDRRVVGLPEREDVRRIGPAIGVLAPGEDVRNGEQLWMIDAGDGTGRVVAPEDRRAKLGIDGSRLYRRLVGTGLCPSTALSRLLRPSPRFDCVVDEVDTGFRESVQVAPSLSASPRLRTQLARCFAMSVFAGFQPSCGCASSCWRLISAIVIGPAASAYRGLKRPTFRRHMISVSVSVD